MPLFFAVATFRASKNGRKPPTPISPFSAALSSFFPMGFLFFILPSPEGYRRLPYRCFSFPLPFLTCLRASLSPVCGGGSSRSSFRFRWF